MGEEQPSTKRLTSAARDSHSHHPHSSSIGRGVTTAAVIVAAAAGACAVGLVSGLLTLFGWGAAIVAGIVIVGVAAAIRPRPANGWLLVPVLALAIPAAAVAVSGVRVMPQRDTVVESPTTTDQIPRDGYRAGFGHLLVDLRGLIAKGGERIVVRAGSDLGRTVVALPRNRCFNLDVRWRAGRLRLPRVREHATVAGYGTEFPLDAVGQWGPGYRKKKALIQGRIALFGMAHGDAQGHWVAAANGRDAPTLSLELRSEGGSFVVRDYPDDVSPLRTSDWLIGDVPPLPAKFVGHNMFTVFLRRAVDGRRSSGWSLPGSGFPAITRAEMREFVAKNPRRHDIFDPQGRLKPAPARMVRRWERQVLQSQQAFGRKWAERVAGTCNRPGSFR